MPSLPSNAVLDKISRERLSKDLFLEDNLRRRGSSAAAGRYFKDADEARLARAFLEQVLLDPDELEQHTVFLVRDLYKTRFEPPVPRQDRVEGASIFPVPPRPELQHCHMIPERQALAIAEKGIAALDDDEVARLLLNPYALYDLSDLIYTLIPESWFDAIAETGERMMERVEIEIAGLEPEVEQDEIPVFPPCRGPAVVKADGSLELTFEGDESRAFGRKIAAWVYGNSDQSFALYLISHERTEKEGQQMMSYVLKAAPCPWVHDLELKVTFGQVERMFVVAVPDWLRKKPLEERSATRPDERSSAPCEPLPDNSLGDPLTGAWNDSDGSPWKLVLRGGRRRVVAKQNGYLSELTGQVIFGAVGDVLLQDRGDTTRSVLVLAATSAPDIVAAGVFDIDFA